jgi:putative endonuclease
LATAKSVLGNKAESLTAGELVRMGYTIVERNFRCRYGEIDIIARDGNCLVFVEVRSHASTEFGPPAESVGLRKQNRLYLTAETYLDAKKLENVDCRFDVVEVIFAKGSAPSVKVIQNAFDTTGL